MRTALVLLLACACAPATEPAQSTSQVQPIVGGKSDLDGGYPAVFFVRMEFDNGMRAACSSTLITPRSLLTAAHCVDPAMAGATSVEIYVLDDSPAPPSDAGMWIHATDHAYHPSWDHSSPTNYDVGMILLPSPPPVTPVPFESRDESALSGAAIQTVGYGITMPGAMDFGVRREVDLIVRNVDSQHLIVGDQSGKGICNGDSGGPSLHTGADGIARVVGIHSYDNGGCVDGLDTRPDVYKAFIEDFINTKEGAGCGEDGICKSGCSPADVDCVCIPDGQCLATCPNLLTDPDCPANCVSNGVCSTVDCPSLDPDCTADYSNCAADAECEHRDCANDAVNSKHYCTRHCAQPGDCPSPSVCTNGDCLIDQGPVANPGETCTYGTTRCLNNTNCTSLGGVNDRCAFPCSTDSDCDPMLVCKSGSNGFKLCVPPPPPPDMTPDAGDGGNIKGSCGNCSSAPGLQLLALLLLARKITSPSSRR